MPALGFELFSNCFLDRRVTDHCLLRGANGSVVETLSSKDVLHRLGHVRSSFNERRNITRTDAERGFADNEVVSFKRPAGMGS